MCAGKTWRLAKGERAASRRSSQFALRDPQTGLTLGRMVIRPSHAPVAQLANGHDNSGAESPGVVTQPATSRGPRAREARRPAAICRVAVAWYENALASRRSKSSGLLSRRCGFEPRRAYLLRPRTCFEDRRGRRHSINVRAREVIDRLLQALIALAPQTSFSVIPLHNPRKGADAQIFRGGAHPVGIVRQDERETERGSGTATSQLTAAREVLAALPDVAAVSARADSLTVRFADAAIARLGERLEAGEEGVLDARDLLGGAEVVVNFCDANPTKALHIGHLRNIALGQALAGALAAAGARVTRQSQVSDYCRSMGEALVGYMELPEHTTPRSLGVKSDHFVGECFGRYAGRSAERPDAEGTDDQPPSAERRETEGADDPALSAEAAVRNDLADRLLERMSAGDPEIVERWRRAARMGADGPGGDAGCARREHRPAGVRVGLAPAYPVDPRPRRGRRRADAHGERRGRVRDAGGGVPAAAAGARRRLSDPAPAHDRAVALAARDARRDPHDRAGGRGVAGIRALPRAADARRAAGAHGCRGSSRRRRISAQRRAAPPRAAPTDAPSERQRDLRNGHRRRPRGEVEQRQAPADRRDARAAHRLPGAERARRAERGTLRSCAASRRW